jgi:hypothetical protein
MAIQWVQGGEMTLEEAEKEIIAISDFELSMYGEFHDTSAKDTVERIFKGYFHYEDALLTYGIDIQDIIQELSKGSIVIVPVNGQVLQNPHYTPPGPREHMIVIVGYDNKSQEFIVHDSGTRFGKNFRYSSEVLELALQDHETGRHMPSIERRTAMITVAKGKR